jgi:hypothetical protein
MLGLQNGKQVLHFYEIKENTSQKTPEMKFKSASVAGLKQY